MGVLYKLYYQHPAIDFFELLKGSDGALYHILLKDELKVELKQELKEELKAELKEELKEEEIIIEKAEINKRPDL